MAGEKKNKVKEKKQHDPNQLSPRARKFILWGMWAFFLGPFLLIFSMLFIVSFDDNMPSIEELANPKNSEATIIYSADGQVLGKYFKENRVNVEYNELSQFLIDCLIATEDIRYYEHTGVDFKALPRVFTGALSGDNSKGGGSTITQQLAKMLFPREKMTKWQFTKRKFKEWIIATRLERAYTKEEILTMYLNKFDFIHNAVGISSAARVYFNTTPDSLRLEQAAMLIGMCQNPAKWDPIRFSEKAMKRREIVLFQLMTNSGSEYIKTKITKEQYDSLRVLPLGLSVQKVDHVVGLAPYFREVLRSELTELFERKNENGEYVYHKKDGSKYDIYNDGLRIYTTIDSRMQKYAEWSVQEHLGKELQKAFDKDNKRWKNSPFSNEVNEEEIEKLINQSVIRSARYKVLKGKLCGNCERGHEYIRKEGNKFVCTYCAEEIPVRTEEEIKKIFNTKTTMTVFSWTKPNYEFDTTMTPMDSIIYYKKFLQAGMMAMDPKTGFIKAWVGGPNFKHFQYDHVKQGTRQVGSTFKPFVYAAAIRDRLFSMCSEIPDIQHCIEVPFTAKTTKPWCPGGSSVYTGDMTPLYWALPASMNNITVAIMKQCKPATVIKMAEALGIEKGYLEPVPSICLGSCDLSVHDMVGAQSAFANNGIFIRPMMYTRIEDRNGNVIVDVEPETNEAMDEYTAYMMLQIMKGTTSGAYNPHTGKAAGTALRLRSNKPYGKLKNPIAGKTGTTDSNSDGWFIGLTPDLVAGVWVGCEDRSVHFRGTDLGQGANMALPIWGYFFNKVIADKTLKISQGDFERPDNMPEELLNCKDYKSSVSDIWNSINLQEVEVEGFEMNDRDSIEIDLN